MSGFTVEQKRAHVLAYLAVPYGRKREYLREHAVSGNMVRRWRSQMYAGTLEVGLVPRGGFMNDPDANRELSRMVDEVARLRRQLDDQQQAHEQALAAKQSEVDSAQQAVQALGKAIALLHAGNESAGSTTGD
jgi:hypothetical protein